MRGLSPAVASGVHSSSRCAGLSLSRPLLLRSTGSRRAGSVIVAHGPSCSTACGIFPDQGSNPRPPHWQADSQPLRHQGSPSWILRSSLSKFLVKNFREGHVGKSTTTIYLAKCFYKIWKFILLETCSFPYKTMASLPGAVSSPTNLLASSQGSCERNSRSGKFGWDNLMFIYMKFNYTYQPYSDLAAVVMIILNWFLKHLVTL